MRSRSSRRTLPTKKPFGDRVGLRYPGDHAGLPTAAKQQVSRREPSFGHPQGSGYGHLVLDHYGVFGTQRRVASFAVCFQIGAANGAVDRRVVSERADWPCVKPINAALSAERSQPVGRVTSLVQGRRMVIGRSAGHAEIRGMSTPKRMTGRTWRSCRRCTAQDRRRVVRGPAVVRPSRRTSRTATGSARWR
jgi:hypothetical protein